MCVYVRAGMFAVNLRRYGNTPQTITIHDYVVCVYVRAGTFAVNLRRYGNTPQTITIHDLVEISVLCAAHATIMFS